jgi:hypothetical protein
MTVEGYALVFNSPTVLFKQNGIEYKEVIDQRALDNTNLSDVVLRYNHNDVFAPLSRTRGGNMTLTVDNNGLYFRAKLFDTSASRDIFTLIQQGVLSSMSFGFVVGKENYDAKTHTRKILEFNKLFEISIVDFPAYNDTSVEARDIFSAYINKESQEREELLRQLYITMLRK